MQKLINLGYGLTWDHCHECELRALGAFMCPVGLWRRHFKMCAWNAINACESAQHYLQFTVGEDREGDAREGKITSVFMVPEVHVEDATFERGQSCGSSGQHKNWLCRLEDRLGSHRGTVWTREGTGLAGRTVWQENGGEVEFWGTYKLGTV